MLPKAKTIYFHVDVNSAFLSWTAIQHLANGETLDLRTVPAVVGGDEEKRHGVVLAKSIPAKRYGIQTGESLFMARSKCPNLIVAAPDFDWYVKNSKAMIRIFGDYTPDIEQYSIDEAFLNMTGSEGLFGPPLQAAQTIKDRIHRELGFTVNIGIAPNRLLAKMASDFEKPDKIHVLTQDMVPQKLWPLPVGNLFGVRGQVFRDYANGIESEPMTRSEVKDNSYGNSVTTPQDLKRPVEADATMLALCESVAGRLRMDGKTARVITVQLVDNAFRRSSHQVTLNSPTNSTDVIYHTARELMRQMWPDRPVRLVGVSAEKTGTDNFEQLDFFTDPAKTDKQEKLDRAADALRARFGEGAILRAKLLHPDEKTTAPKALGAAKARDKRKGEL